MTVRCKGKCFEIALSPTYLRNSPALLEEYLGFAEVAEADGDLNGLTIDDFQDWTLRPFLQLFRDVQPNPDFTVDSFTLGDYFNPETLHYSLRAVDDKFTPCLEEGPKQQKPLQGVDLDDYDIGTAFPSFNPFQIQICLDDPEDAFFESPSQVLLEDGKTHCYFKPLEAGEKWSAIRELESYKRIAPLQLGGGKAQVARLHGVVQDHKTGRYLGLLLSWIDCQNTTLEWALDPETPTSLRRKWADQLAASLDYLHQAGVIWGDVKPGNVLVDANGCAVDLLMRCWVIGGVASPPTRIMHMPCATGLASYI